MRIERISSDQFTIFLSFDDLDERGFTQEELWRNPAHIEALFGAMMYEASTALDLELAGMLLVQVQIKQAQGMHVIVTQKQEAYDEDDFMDPDFIEMEVTLDESEELIFAFNSFESIIQVATHLAAKTIAGGQVFYLNNTYYMYLDDVSLQGELKEDIIAIMSEYAQPSIMTSHRLQAYGNVIYRTDAIKQIMNVFY